MRTAGASAMAQPDPTQQPWIVGATMLIVGGIASAITTVVNGIINRRTNNAAAAKALAEAEKVRAEGDGVRVTAQIELSEAAMSLVTGLHEELNRMRNAHAEEIREIREAHRLEMATLRENHAREMSTMQEALDKKELEIGLLRAQVTKLEARINAGGMPDAPVISPLPEVPCDGNGCPTPTVPEEETL